MDSRQALLLARRRRERLLARITWWEDHRYAALAPVALLSFGLGWGLGYLVQWLAHAPSVVSYLSGLAALFLTGRLLDRHFSPTRLAVLDARIAGLERQVRP